MCEYVRTCVEKGQISLDIHLISLLIKDLVESHGLLDFGNGTTWVQTLWTGLGTVHNGVASV